MLTYTNCGSDQAKSQAQNYYPSTCRSSQGLLEPIPMTRNGTKKQDTNRLVTIQYPKQKANKT